MTEKNRNQTAADKAREALKYQSEAVENNTTENFSHKEDSGQEEVKENKETDSPGKKASAEEQNRYADENESPGEEDMSDRKEEKHKKDNKDDTIEELESKFIELSEKHLRLQAEFDNFRRRTMREKAELIKSGGEQVLTEILPVIDDFERAIDSMKEISDEDAGKQGTLLIYSKFKDFLKRHNVNEIDALHKDFDVDHHEALTKIPAPEKKLKGKVVDVVQKGYTLNDKVIRFAKVVVGE